MAIKKLTFLICTLVSVFFFQNQSIGQSQTFKSGSAIIDMGSAIPTVKNSLKPYGLIYSLLKYYNVPVSCVINQTKAKDGIDFTYSNKNYKGGTYIISADYITSQITAVLNSWVGQGVLVDYTNSDLTVNVTYKLNFAPKWVMDKTNGVIAVGFLNAAGIPSSAFSFKTSSQLGDCDDIFILPHADPTWAAHRNLYFWNKNNRGAIWAGCHAVSVLENTTKDTVISGTPTTLRMNFLSTVGLVPFTDHVNGRLPYASFNPADPMSQYTGKTDNAQIAGSETVFLPQIGSAWRPGTKMITSSPVQSDIPSLSPGPAAVNIYGRGFDGATNGYVCYQSSHNIGDATAADQIAAQRVFFNFSLFALNDKVSSKILASISGVPDQLTANTASPTFTANVSGDGGPFTYQWKANIAGSFSSATSASTTFTPSSSITSATKCIITLIVTDANCSRISFDAKLTTVLAQTPPLTSASISKTISGDCSANNLITFNVFDSNVDPNAGTRTLISVTGLANGTVITSTSGSVTYTPAANFLGTDNGSYTISNGNATSTGSINITVGPANLIPVVTGDALTAIVDNVTVVNVLSNDVNNPSSIVNDKLYIRDITVKPTKGYVYINTDKTLSYLSTKDQATVSGGDTFKYLACNDVGYCAVGTVTVTLVQDGCAAGQYQTTQVSTPGSLTVEPSADSYVASNATTSNFGGNTTFLFNGFSTAKRRPILKFDISSISTTATVTSANISFTTSAAFTTSSANNPFPATIYGVTRAWTEGNNTAGNDVTWANFTTSNAWTTAGGDITDLAPNNPVILNSFTDGVSNSIGTVIATQEIKTIVQGWLTPANNNGLILVPNAATASLSVNLHSRTATTASDRPKLNVNYTTPPPCLTIPTSYNPIAYPDTTSTRSNASVIINVKSNDANYYGNTNLVSSVTTPANGTATINGSNNIVYTPNGSFVGTDTLTYTITDQTNSQPRTATVRIIVSRVAPIINTDIVTTNSNTAVTINAGSNDSDPQGTLDVPVITVTAKNGSATISNTNIIYTPSDKFSGKDTLIYQRSNIVSNACTPLLSDTAIVLITITNQAPVAVTDSTTTFACAPVDIDVKTNDTDPEGTTLTAVLVSNPSNGTVVANTNGKYRYSPNTSFTGTDQFTYKVKDGSADSLVSNTVTVKITISGAANPNTAPTPVADSDSTLVNQVMNTNVLINDSDPQNDALSISITAAGLKAPSNGTIQLLGNKMIRYIPNLNFVGTDTYEYEVTDTHPGCSGNSSLSNKALVTIKVKAIPITTSGTVWNDVNLSANDSFDNIFTSPETGTNADGSIYIYLVDSANTIIDQTAVDNAGAYTLVNVPSNTTKLSMILSTATLSIGGTLSIASLPTGFTNTSPVIRAFTTTTADLTGYDFGVVTSTLLGGTISSTSVSFCGSGTPLTLTSSVAPSVGTYQWQSSITSAGAGFANISGATALSHTPSAINATTWYRRKVSNGQPPVYSNVVKVTIFSLPVVTVSPTSVGITVGTSTTLISSGASSYAWSPSTNLSATTGASVVSTPASAGVVTYTVTGTDANSCTNTSTVTITVNPVLTPGTIGSNQTICSGAIPATFTSATNAVGGTGTISYQWQTSLDNVTYTNIVAATSVTLSSGTLTQTTYYRRGASTSSDAIVYTSSVTVTVNALPSVTAGSNSPVCAGSAVNLTSTSGTSYSWSGPNSFTSTSQNPSISGATTAVSGTYTVQVTASNGCTNTTTTSVTVNANPTVAITPTTGTININGSLSLTASGANTYSWTPASNLSATNTATVTAGPLTTTTAYIVTGTLTATGCTNAAAITITVIDPGVIGTDQSNCGTFTPTTLSSVSGASGASGITYQWQSSTAADFSSAVTTITGATSTTYSPVAVSATTYYRRVATSGSSSFNSNVISATVKAIPAIAITPATATINSNGNVLLTASGATTYSWSPATGLSASNTAAVTANPSSTITYTVTGTAANSCTNTTTVTVTVNSGTPVVLTPGTIGSDQTICTAATPASFTSTTSASGGTGTINYQWQQSTDNVNFTNISATSVTYSASALTQTTYYRRGASTSTDAVVYTGPVKVTVLPKPVITGGISGPCSMTKDSTKTFSVTAAPNATSYTWTLPSGWTGTSITNSINVKAGSANGTISVVPFNGTCAGAAVTYSVSIIDYARVTLTGVPVTASGNNNDPVQITIQLIDPNGNPINCSGGKAILKVCSATGTLSSVVDNNNGTYSSILTAYADTVVICGTIDSFPIDKKLKLTFTGPQGGIKGNGPILATETPKLTFTATAGRAPFTIIYRSANNTKNDTLTNITSGTPIGVALIPATTLYTLVSIIDANGERRNTNFIRDTTTIIVLAPRIIVTLHADPAKLEKDSTWSTRLSLTVKNIGNLDLSAVQVKLNLKDVFPSPVTYVLDSVRVNGTTVVANKSYDGIQSNDLFARLNNSGNKLPADITRTALPMGMHPDLITASPGINSLIDDATANLQNGYGIAVYANTDQSITSETEEMAVNEDEHSVYMFGALSQLPIGVDGTMFLYIHLRPNGYYEPFLMQAVALGTGSTAGATALASSLSNDNNDVNAHPELTKYGDPQPTVINLIPNPVIGVSLLAGTPVNQGNGTYNVPLTFKLQNYGNVNLQSIKLFLNLSRMIGSPSTFRLVSAITSTNTMGPNPNYDGILDTNILVGTSELAYKQEGTIQFTINITPNQLSSLYRLRATATAFNTDISGTITDLSTDGTNPDPDGNSKPDEKIITIIAINLPIPPLVPAVIGILVNRDPRIWVLTKAYCGPVSGVRLVTGSSATTGGSGPYEYQWQSSVDNISFADITNAADSTYTTGNVGGNMYFRRRDISDNQLAYTNSVYIQINPVVKPVISASGPLVLPVNGSVTLTSTAASGYLWSNTLTTRSIVVNVGGVGSYSVTTTDANGCPAISDTVLVKPPPPVTVNAIYIVGAITNPPNSGVQVTGYPGATLNYYLLSSGGTLIPVPVLPGVIGGYTYYVSQTINGMESALASYSVTMLDPAKVADLQKVLSKAPALQADGSFLLTFTVLSSNLRGELLDSVKIKDDLTKVFPSSTQYQVVQIKASGKFLSNSLYNGVTQIELLADGSQLPGLQTDSVQVTVKVFPNGFSGILNNVAEQTAKSPYGKFKITSNDPTVGNGTIVRAPTKFIIPQIDIFIPSGFSPNRDGTNDLFVITRPYNVSINLEIFNRWGNLVYRAADYKNEWGGKGNQQKNILGEDLPDGTYYYVVLAIEELTGTVRKFAGFITLKR